MIFDFFSDLGEKNVHHTCISRGHFAPLKLGKKKNPDKYSWVGTWV